MARQQSDTLLRLLCRDIEMAEVHHDADLASPAVLEQLQADTNKLAAFTDNETELQGLAPATDPAAAAAASKSAPQQAVDVGIISNAVRSRYRLTQRMLLCILGVPHLGHMMYV